MRFLFWNTNGKHDINGILCGAIIERKANIVILAEYKDVIEDLLYNLSLNGIIMKMYPAIGCERITILGTVSNVRQSRQSRYYSMQIIDDKFLLCGVHLPSQLQTDENTQLVAFQSVVHDIELAEQESGLISSIVVGDFNRNPYEEGCLGAMYFHGIPVANDAKKLSRTVLGNAYKMFYNPMWNLLGDFNYPPGTYYYTGNKEKNEFWNMFDQVIIRPQLRERFVEEELRIVIKVKDQSLLNKNRHPNKSISDHLPIAFELKEN